MSMSREQMMTKIAAREPFQNSTRTFYGNRMLDGTYVVFSYFATIARWDEANGWNVSTARHSSTTAKHQNIVKEAVAA